jgi:PAS domain S-box-containing protein
LESHNYSTGKGLTSAISSSLLKFILNSKIPFSDLKYSEFKDESLALVIIPLRIIAFLVAIFGLCAMVFEVKFFPEHSVEIYFIRLVSVLVAFTVLVLLTTRFSEKRSILLVHILLLTIIVSSGLMIFLLPSTLLVNASIAGLIIFTSALFLSWEVKNQIVVAIYYNIVFAASILLNDRVIYFLPNMFESVAFVLFLSMVSIIACAINFRMRLLIAERNFDIKLSEEKYRSIIDNSTEGIFQSTLDGRWLTLNRAFAKILGYKNEKELATVDVNDIYVDQNERKDLMEQLQQHNMVKDYEVQLRKKDGSTAVVRLNDRMVADENGRQYFEGNIHDITKQIHAEKERNEAEKALTKEKEKSEKLAQEAIKLSSMKSRFLANMSHEIRTPMNGVLGFLTLIESGSYESQDELSHFSSSARMSAESLLDIINSILDLSKIEAGKIKLENVEFSLLDVIDQSVSVLTTKASEKNIEIIREIEKGTHLNLSGDATKLRQILINLLSNAIKFTANGKVSIKVYSVSSGDGDVELHFSVIDSGIGIPAEKIEALFKPFSQIDGSEAKHVGGSGLGLVICKEYVTLMGGNIKVNSEDGKGSSFDFNVNFKENFGAGSNLPIKDTVKNLMHDTFAATIVGKDYKELRGKYNILLAEDNLINQKVSTKILAASGYKVTAVNNGIEAVESVQNGKYDLVLMDIQMPEMDGLSATEVIRNFNDYKRNIPIIALTAHALMGDREKCIKIGMDDYISKPIIAPDLISKIDKILNLGESSQKPSNGKSLDEDTVFDFERLKKVSLDDFDFEKDLLTSYISDAEEKFSSLCDSIASKELANVIKLAHTLKGASYSVGAKKVGDEAFAIEISGKSNDFHNVEERFGKLKVAISETKLALKEYII